MPCFAAPDRFACNCVATTPSSNAAHPVVVYALFPMLPRPHSQASGREGAPGSGRRLLDRRPNCGCPPARITDMGLLPGWSGSAERCQVGRATACRCLPPCTHAAVDGQWVQNPRPRRQASAGERTVERLRLALRLVICALSLHSLPDSAHDRSFGRQPINLTNIACAGALCVCNATASSPVQPS